MNKYCYKCGRSMPRRNFYKDRSRADGLNNVCKRCSMTQAESWNKENPKKRAASRKADKAKRLQIRVTLLHSAKDRPCVDCDQRYPPCVMDFDHVRGKKLGAVGSMVRRMASEARILTEMAKCEVVCANCHRIRTWKRRRGLL